MQDAPAHDPQSNYRWTRDRGRRAVDNHVLRQTATVIGILVGVATLFTMVWRLSSAATNVVMVTTTLQARSSADSALMLKLVLHQDSLAGAVHTMMLQVRGLRVEVDDLKLHRRLR